MRRLLQLVTADVYLYTAGFAEIPTDLESAQMHDIFDASLNEIGVAAARGIYEGLEFMTRGSLALPPHALDPVWLWAVIRYRQADGAAVATRDRVSHLAIRSDSGWIMKLRYTYPAVLPPQWAYNSFLVFAFEWKHSVDRFRAGRGAVPPEGDASDPVWQRLVGELRRAPLPHRLGFFDPVLAEAYQEELMAGLLHADEDAPERELDEHEADLVLHEMSHAIYAILEGEMALQLPSAGLGQFVEGHRPEASGDE